MSILTIPHYNVEVRQEVEDMFRSSRFSPYVLTVVIMLVLTAGEPQARYAVKHSMEPTVTKEQYVAGDGVVLPVRSWLPKSQIKAVIIALHGFNDYSNAFTTPAGYLSTHGIACYAYDQRGFGKAPGRGRWAGIEAYTSDLAGFVKQVRKRHPKVPLYVVGESMGGAVTMVTMAQSNPPHVDGVILVAPAVWGRKTMPWYQRWVLAAAYKTVPWLELTGKGLSITPSDNIPMRRALGQDPLVIKASRVDTLYGLTNLMDEALSRAGDIRVPTLILYGQNDQIIPKKPTFIMLGKMAKTTRKAFYDTGYHMLLRDLQGEKPLADIATWVTDRNKPLLYGKADWK